MKSSTPAVPLALAVKPSEILWLNGPGFGPSMNKALLVPLNGPSSNRVVANADVVNARHRTARPTDRRRDFTWYPSFRVEDRSRLHGPGLGRATRVEQFLLHRK